MKNMRNFTVFYCGIFFFNNWILIFTLLDSLPQFWFLIAQF